MCRIAVSETESGNKCKADGYQAKVGLGKDLAKLLSKVTLKSFISTRALRSKGWKLEMRKEG